MENEPLATEAAEGTAGWVVSWVYSCAPSSTGLECQECVFTRKATPGKYGDGFCKEGPLESAQQD